MNQRYRKVMRLRSRHARRGHTPWCNCPEMWQALRQSIQRRMRKDPLFLAKMTASTRKFVQNLNLDK